MLIMSLETKCLQFFLLLGNKNALGEFRPCYLHEVSDVSVTGIASPVLTVNSSNRSWRWCCIDCVLLQIYMSLHITFVIKSFSTIELTLIFTHDDTEALAFSICWCSKVVP